MDNNMKHGLVIIISVLISVGLTSIFIEPQAGQQGIPGESIIGPQGEKGIPGEDGSDGDTFSLGHDCVMVYNHVWESHDGVITRTFTVRGEIALVQWGFVSGGESTRCIVTITKHNSPICEFGEQSEFYIDSTHLFVPGIYTIRLDPNGHMSRVLLTIKEWN